MLEALLDKQINLKKGENVVKSLLTVNLKKHNFTICCRVKSPFDVNTTDKNQTYPFESDLVCLQDNCTYI